MSDDSQFKVTFEMVSAIAHPEYYRFERAIVQPHEVPEEHWYEVENLGTRSTIMDQFIGLRELVASGELIRNVRLFKAGGPQWTDVTP